MASQFPTGGSENDIPALRLVARDAGPFLKIAGTYSYTKLAPRYGDVVVSPTAIYLVKGQQVSLNHAFGLAGALVQAAVDKREDDLRSCLLAELPQAVREQFPRWQRFADLDAIVLPRACVHRIETMWTGGLRVFCGEDCFQLNSRLFRAAKARTFLRAHGWTLNEDVEPTAATVHGDGFARTATTPPSPLIERATSRREPSRSEQFVYAAIAIVVVTVLVVAKFHQARRASASAPPAIPQRSVANPDPYWGSHMIPPKPPRH